MVPVFTEDRLISPASSFAPAASPRLRRRLSPWPPHRHAKPASESARPMSGPCTATRPISTRFEPVPRLRSFATGSSRMPSDLACRTRPVWQSRAAPALSALLPALTGVSRIGLRSAPTGPLRRPGKEVLHLLRFSAPHGAQAPRGADRPCGLSPQLGSGRPYGDDAGAGLVLPVRCRQSACMRWYAACSPGVPRSITAVMASLRMAFRMVLCHCSHSRSS
jgi:hypothetical protein